MSWARERPRCRRAIMELLAAGESFDTILQMHPIRGMRTQIKLMRMEANHGNKPVHRIE